MRRAALATHSQRRGGTAPRQPTPPYRGGRRAAGLLCLLLCAAPLCAQTRSQIQDGRWYVSIHSLRGDVEVRLAGADGWAAPRRITPLEEGDEIRVNEGGRAELAFGSSAVVQLRPGTRALLRDLRPERTRLQLLTGTMLQKIKSLAYLKKIFDRDFRWEVRTPTVACAVRGTEFGVQVSSGAGTTAGVFDEGELALRPLGEEGEGLALGPNQEAEVLASGRIGEARPLKTMLAYRLHMRRIRKKLAAIQRRYRTLPLKKRRELRRRLRERSE